MISKEIQSLVRPNIIDLKPYKSARHEFVRTKNSMLFLDANENPYGKFNRYPDPLQTRLKNIIAHIENVSPEQIFIGNGSGEIIQLICTAFCIPRQDCVLTMPPTFSLFQIIAQTHEIQNISVPLTKEFFQLDTTSILNQIADKNPKIIFITSPNNPTGNSFNIIDIKQILNYSKGLVVIDEAYIDFTEQPSFKHFIEDFSRLIVVRTLSKGKGLASARIGIGFANPEIITILNKVKPPFNVSTSNQETAISRLKNTDEINYEVTEIIKQRQWLMQELSNFDFVVKTYPSDANFILIKVIDSNNLYRKLISKGIVVRNISGYLHCENTLRITVGLKKENEFLIESLKAIENQ